MKPFYLVETTTRDRLIHQGIFYKPKRPGKWALLWVHGLTSTFYGNLPLIEAVAEKCGEMGFGFVSFNNRGHDIVTNLKKIDRRQPKGYTRITGGAGIEDFKDSIYDIEAGIHFLVDRGFDEVVVIGHSTGANKVCYYAGSKYRTHVVGYVLASPVSDRLDPSVNKVALAKNLTQMQELVNQGKGDELVTGYHAFPVTSKRFLSSFVPNSLEDQFDYGDPRPRMRYFSKIKKPLLVVIGSKDEYLDRSVRKVLAVFNAYQRSTNYKSVVLKNAFHSYNGTEPALVETIFSWVKSLR